MGKGVEVCAFLPLPCFSTLTLKYKIITQGRPKNILASRFTYTRYVGDGFNDPREHTTFYTIFNPGSVSDIMCNTGSSYRLFSRTLPEFPQKGPRCYFQKSGVTFIYDLPCLADFLLTQSNSFDFKLSQTQAGWLHTV